MKELEEIKIKDGIIQPPTNNNDELKEDKDKDKENDESHNSHNNSNIYKNF